MPRLRRTRTGEFRLELPDVERDLLRSIPGQLRELLTASTDLTGNPAVARLFPPAHPDDPSLEADFRSMVGDELLGRRLQALEVMEETIDAERLTEDQVLAWLGALNDARLVLGTRLEVSEETVETDFDDDPDAASAFAVYTYLTFLEDQVVLELSA